MLNRRILRVKAMQALYSYYTTQGSLKEVNLERLQRQFYPDPAKDDFTQADQFTLRRKKASKLFEENLRKKKINPESELDEDIMDAVQKAIDQFYNDLADETRSIKKTMLADVDEIFKLYLKLVSLPIEFAHIEKLEKEKKEKAHISQPNTNWKWHLINNPLIDELTKFEAFNKALISSKISWSSEFDLLKGWYKEVLRKDEVIAEYESKDVVTLEDHKSVLVYFFKHIIFKNESINEFLSENDMHWQENKSILRSLVVKTFQDFEKDLKPPFELKKISKNEEDDLAFFKLLFEVTLKKDLELDELIEKKIQNWDITRVALTDRIILKMALAEMISFHSIPTKVTINEFIEISKVYSTPKSKQFINGILDVLANELTSDGVIRKSGRGLIDNK